MVLGGVSTLTPVFWQTYLSDPASITMEGILILNKTLFDYAFQF